MKTLIASDIHGSARRALELVRAFEREGADEMLLLGDILYHGPRNDLPDGYDTRETARILNRYAGYITCVRGNCDAEVDQMMLEFDIGRDSVILEWDGLRVFVTHGHRRNLSSPPPVDGVDVLLHGHTHIPAWEKGDGFWYFNPGSTSIPKGGSDCGYMVYEAREFVWKTMDGEIVHRERL